MSTTPEVIAEPESAEGPTREEHPLLKRGVSDLPIADEFLRRWSPRSFQDRPISDRVLATLLEAARWAPSSFNEQPWRFLVARNGDEEGFGTMLSCLNEGNRTWAERAPLLMLTATRTHFSETGEPNRHAYHDLGLAMGSLTVQATAMSLFVHQMAGIDPERARDVYDVPDPYDVVAAVAIGYLGDPDRLEDPSRHAAELRERHRKPLRDLVFEGTWGGAAPLPGLSDRPDDPDTPTVTGGADSPATDEARTLRSLDEVRGYRIDAVDGEIGSCDDFLIDDRRWVVRYMVVDTGHWFLDRRVLVSPISLGEPDWPAKRFPVFLATADIETAPRLERDEPVSRRYEAALFRHHRYAPYWDGLGLWGFGQVPTHLREAVLAAQADPEAVDAPAGHPHLRSAREVTGYHIRALNDESVGHVEDLLVDDRSWEIRYLVVDTRNWLPGRKLLVSPDWLTGIAWHERTVDLDLTRSQIEASPPYRGPERVHRAYEASLHRHYGRQLRAR